MSLVVYLVQWVFYLIGLSVFLLYSFLQFISKPGTRFVFPIALIGLILWQRDFVHTVFGAFTGGMLGGETTVTSYLAWGLVGVVILIIGWFYVYLSRALGLLLGIFPPITRPLMPVRKLEAPRAANTRPAVVRLAVPPLPRS